MCLLTSNNETHREKLLIGYFNLLIKQIIKRITPYILYIDTNEAKISHKCFSKNIRFCKLSIFYLIV
ncbi:hypothetical protein GCM10023262_10640 [Bartonella pachyuromydis]|uniref:Uncharacterized protein n=1 Tax=Bartonella pachyuromydis TaxID=931097 RepID=A0ABP8VIY8_9HYPH